MAGKVKMLPLSEGGKREVVVTNHRLIIYITEIFDYPIFLVTLPTLSSIHFLQA